MDLVPSFTVDSDVEEQTIYFSKTTENGLYYAKHRYLHTDFFGRPIEDRVNFIRIKSIWYTDLTTGQKVELVPFGEFDINNTYLSKDYLYFIKNIDRDGDGILSGQDYESGEVWRINRNTNSLEFCFDIGEYNLHFFEVGGERYVIFTSEDTKPDMTEEVVVDLVERKRAVISSLHLPGKEYDYRFIKDATDNPLFLVAKPWVGEGELSSASNKLWCCSWCDLIKQLHWVDL